MCFFNFTYFFLISYLFWVCVTTTVKGAFITGSQLAEENSLNALLVWLGALRHTTTDALVALGVGRPVQEKMDGVPTAPASITILLKWVGWVCVPATVYHIHYCFQPCKWQIPTQKLFNLFFHCRMSKDFSANQNQPYTITAFSLFQHNPQKRTKGSLNILTLI